MLLPVIASIEDRLAALGEDALRRQPELTGLLDRACAMDRQRCRCA